MNWNLISHDLVGWRDLGNVMCREECREALPSNADNSMVMTRGVRRPAVIHDGKRANNSHSGEEIFVGLM